VQQGVSAGGAWRWRRPSPRCSSACTSPRRCSAQMTSGTRVQHGALICLHCNILCKRPHVLKLPLQHDAARVRIRKLHYVLCVARVQLAQCHCQCACVVALHHAAQCMLSRGRVAGGASQRVLLRAELRKHRCERGCRVHTLQEVPAARGEEPVLIPCRRCPRHMARSQSSAGASALPAQGPGGGAPAA
jgi:hypothetical protein